jgi:hypothetical protein
MNMTTFWDIQPCNLVEVDWRFRSAYYLHHYDDVSSLHHLRSEDKSSTHLWHFSQITRTAWRYIPESCHIHCSWNIAPYAWRYRLWRTFAGWAAAAGSLSRLHQTVLGWHVVSISNPTPAFSAFQTGPLLLYSSNYSVYPITRLSGPRSRPNSLRKILMSAQESNPGPLCL